MKITIYDVSEALKQNNIPSTFTIGEAKKFSDFFKDRRVPNLLKKMSNTNLKLFNIKVKRLSKVNKSTTWGWEVV